MDRVLGETVFGKLLPTVLWYRVVIISKVRAEIVAVSS